MRFHSYLNSATRILNDYRGPGAFSIFLKTFFRQNKKYGGRDRREISNLCYSYFRLGKSLTDKPIEERVLAGVFLCSSTHNEFLKFHRPDWNEKVALPLSEKLNLLEISLSDVFAWPAELSEAIDFEAYAAAFFQQPNLYLRIRPEKKGIAIKKLDDMFAAKEMPSTGNYQLLGDDCIALPNSTRLGEIFTPDKEVVIQDLNSQKVLDFLKPGNIDGGLDLPTTPKTWDCCAASGGKSILAYDRLAGKIDLTVTDLRKNSLANLKKRFSNAGIKAYQAMTVDLTQMQEQSFSKGFQLIICDAPCSGSGTWGRTPEQLALFEKHKIAEYASLQRDIVSNAIPKLKQGYFVYITCSVFRSENEEIANFIQDNLGLELVEMKVLKGYTQKADTMFTAVFRKG